MTDCINVVIADDHPLVTEGIKSILESFDNINVLATVSDGQQLLDQFPDLNPDVVLMDLNMPVLNGLATTEILLEQHPQARILVLSMHDSAEYISPPCATGPMAICQPPPASARIGWR